MRRKRHGVFHRFGAGLVAAAVAAGAIAAGSAPLASAAPGDVTTVAGGGWSGATLHDGYGLARRGNTLYVVDSTGQVVTRDLTNGRQAVIAGTGNASDPLGDGGPAVDANLNNPFAIAVDGSGNVFVSETDAGSSGSAGCRIRRIDHTTHVIATYVGDGNCNQSDGDGGPATSAHVGGWTFAMAADTAGNVFTATGSSVRRVDHVTHEIDTVAGQLNSSGQTADGATLANARFACLSAIAIDPNHDDIVYVSDSCNNAIYKIDLTHDVVHPVVGGGAVPNGVEVDPGANPVGSGYNGSFSGVPVADARVDFSDHVPMAVSPSGELYFGDGRDNNDPAPHIARIRKLSVDGHTVTDVVGAGPYGDVTNAGPAATTEVAKIRGMAFDQDGGLYFSAENGQTLHYVDTGADPAGYTCIGRTGNESCIFDVAEPLANGDGGPATDASISRPLDLVRVGSDLFMAEQYPARVRKINWKTGIITTFAGTGTPGSSGDGHPATQAELGYPTALAYDKHANSILISGQDAKVRSVDLRTNIISTIAGTGVPGYSGDHGPAVDAELSNEIVGLAVKADGTIVMADSANHVLRAIDPAGIVTTIAGDGTEGHSPDGTLATAAHLVAPSRVVVDTRDDSVVFADFCNLDKVLTPMNVTHQWDQIQSVCDQRVRRIDPATGQLVTVAGTQGMSCEPDISAIIHNLETAFSFTADPSLFETDPLHDDVVHPCGDGLPATQASLRSPVALRYDAAGNLYIGEIGGSFLDYMLLMYQQLTPADLQPSIRKVDHRTGLISTIANRAHRGAGFSGDGGPATEATFGFPAAIAPDGGTHLFIADNGNNRIRRIEGPKPDLRVALSADGALTAGSSGVLHVTVTNAAAAGSEAYLTGPVSADVTLPAGLSFASASVVSPAGVRRPQDAVASWSCDGSGQSVSCTTPDNLAPQASSTFDVTVNVDPNAPESVTVNANGSSDSDVADPGAQIAVLGITIQRSVAPAPNGGTETDGGYVLAGADGGTFAFGPASFPGAVAVSGNRVVGGAPAGAHGSWLVAADGSVFTTGDAEFFGSLGNTRLNSPIVGIAADGATGYWLVAGDGGVFAFGSAVFRGSLGATRLNSPIVGMAASPSGDGYWLVAADGGVFAEGDAPFLGSLGATRLNSPIVGMAASPSGEGYWLVASDGGVFAYGDATFAGSHADGVLSSPVVAIVSTTAGTGYRLVARDGGVFAYGTATYDGSLAATRLNAPVIAAW